jgi:4-methylaminobutanoate oxidase (formaldehyde-forming)
MRERMQEAVSDLFALHWPFKQPAAGRDLRRSPLHGRWAAEGAVFGLTAGWERGLWYAASEAERNLPYSVAGRQPWQAIAEREAAQMRDGAGLLDLTPFTKIDVTGRDALSLLNHLAAAQLDVAIGRAVYTPLLNERGGIEADVTITRLAENHFRLVSGAATRRRDIAMLRRAARAMEVGITDRTEEFCVIGVMGAGARRMLSALSSGEWDRFPFATARGVTVGGAACLATRLSYAGEPGWELTIANAQAETVFDALITGGARPVGHHALNGCRIEKGYRHWGHDLGPEITPLEAGLSFTIDWTKDFRGKPALERQRRHGIGRRLVLLSLDGDPLMLHDEPVHDTGGIVGLTTSGARGVRTGLTLALALIRIAPGETPAETAGRSLSVDVAGTRHRAQVLQKPPYDPASKRMLS